MLLHNVEFIIGTVSLLFAYIFSVMLVGRAEAEVAARVGDHTPEEAGFLSWDPLIFADLPGFLCLLIIGLGWGRLVPFNPHNVTGRHKLLTVFLVYLAQPIFSLLLAFLAMIIIVFLVGPDALGLAFANLSETAYGQVFKILVQAYQDEGVAAFTLVCVSIMLSIVSFNIFNTVWGLINNGFRYFLFIGDEHGHEYMKHAEAITFFGPLVAIILFTVLLRYNLTSMLVYLASGIASFCGVSV